LVPLATTAPIPPIGLDFLLNDAMVSAGDRPFDLDTDITVALAVTVVVTNRSRGNRGISLNYDGGSTPSRIILDPSAVPSPTR
jgi:hypothetical protein